MKLTTLCYIEKDDCFLMLHRVHRKKDKQDGSEEKYIGVGGHFESGESPEECIRREILEETALQVENLRFRGIVTFVSDVFANELMFLFTATPAEAQKDEIPPSCDEGELAYIPKNQILSLNLWEGDRYFLTPLLESPDSPFFSLKLRYRGDTLESAVFNEMPVYPPEI